MRAVLWEGPREVRLESLPDPHPVQDSDAVVRVHAAGIGGSDLQAYSGHLPGMRRGTVLGHEFLGTVHACGRAVRSLKPGDRVVVLSLIACGSCPRCLAGETALCLSANQAAGRAERLVGGPLPSRYGLSDLFGGYPGGNAGYVRVPYAEFGALPLPPGMEDEKALALCEAFPAGYLAAKRCGLREGETLAVWGAGPVGQFAAWSAGRLGAGRVFVVDPHPERLRMAEDHSGARTILSGAVDVVAALRRATGGRGPDACIDTVGMEARGDGLDRVYDYARGALRIPAERVRALQEAIAACRPGGTIVLVGLCLGPVDRLELGAAFAKGLSLHTGPLHLHAALPEAMRLTVEGAVDPSFVVTHVFPLEAAVEAYRMAHAKGGGGCVKIVLKPGEAA